MPAHDTNPCKIFALGEIAIRCNNLLKMRDFYRDVIGLSILKDFSDAGGIVFFDIAKGHGGHRCVLALFDKSAGAQRGHATSSISPETGARSSLHHLALTVEFEAQDALRDFLDRKGITHRTEKFEWIGWRGVFVSDPEGNTIEFVAAQRELNFV